MLVFAWDRQGILDYSCQWKQACDVLVCIFYILFFRKHHDKILWVNSDLWLIYPANKTNFNDKHSWKNQNEDKCFWTALLSLTTFSYIAHKLDKKLCPGFTEKLILTYQNLHQHIRQAWVLNIQDALMQWHEKNQNECNTAVTALWNIRNGTAFQWLSKNPGLFKT